MLQKEIAATFAHLDTSADSAVLGLCSLDMSFKPFPFCKQMLSKHDEGRSVSHEVLLQQFEVTLQESDSKIHHQTIVVS